MMGRMLTLFLLCLGFIFSVTPRAGSAQAWPQRRGHTYLKLSHSRVAASHQWDFNGDKKPYAENVAGNAFFDRSFYLYGEYGLTDNLTAVVLLPFKRITVRDGELEYTTEGLGSVTLGLRVGLKSFLKVSAPAHTFALNISATVPTGYTRNLSPSLGPGQADFQAVFSYGISLYPLPLYGQAGLGYRVRTAIYSLSSADVCPTDTTPGCVEDSRPEFTDEWLFSGEIGGWLGRRALLQVLTQGVWSNLSPETGFNPINPVPTRERFIKTGAGLTLYPIPNLGMSVQYFATPFGRNTIDSSDWFFGVEYQFDAPL